MVLSQRISSTSARKLTMRRIIEVFRGEHGGSTFSYFLGFGIVPRTI